MTGFTLPREVVIGGKAYPIHTDYRDILEVFSYLEDPELPEFMELARSRGFKSILTTNGTLLKKRQEEMLRAHPHKISVSLHSFEDGTREDHRQYLADVASFAEKAAPPV